jgi:NOL1/NOP2/fmu family ribosome biogenesis protein
MNSQIKILNLREKKEIQKELEKEFGIKNIPGELIKKGEEKIFLFQGNMTPKEIKEIEEFTLIERIGVYFAKEQGGEIRLSIEGTHLLKEQINENIFEMSEEQEQDWIKGRELNIKTGKHQFLVMKYGEDFLGCGKASAEKITNFIPKTRRLKSRE